MSETIGTRIRELRAALGLTKVDLAALLGVTPQAVWLWESGGRSISAENLFALADALRVDVRELFLGSKQSEVAAASPAPGIDASRLALALGAVEEAIGNDSSSCPIEKRAKIVAYLYSSGAILSKDQIRQLIELFE